MQAPRFVLDFCNRIELSTAYVLKLFHMSMEVITTASILFVFAISLLTFKLNY